LPKKSKRHVVRGGADGALAIVLTAIFIKNITVYIGIQRWGKQMLCIRSYQLRGNKTIDMALIIAIGSSSYFVLGGVLYKLVNDYEPAHRKRAVVDDGKGPCFYATFNDWTTNITRYRLKLESTEDASVIDGDIEIDEYPNKQRAKELGVEYGGAQDIMRFLNAYGTKVKIVKFSIYTDQAKKPFWSFWRKPKRSSDVEDVIKVFLKYYSTLKFDIAHADKRFTAHDSDFLNANHVMLFEPKDLDEIYWRTFTFDPELGQFAYVE
jgi:hypothetical protein